MNEMTEEFIEKIKEFLEREYDNIVQAIEKGKSSIIFDYKNLDSFDPELADFLLDSPQEFLEELEKQTKEISGGEVELKARFTSLPISAQCIEHTYKKHKKQTYWKTHKC